MTKLEWIPEAFPRTGGLAAAGFYKLLGRPRLDPLTVLVRETAQNSWDARQGDDDPVWFSIEGWQLEKHERQALRDRVFVHAARTGNVPLLSALADPGLNGLFICDRNTKGLGGPFRADTADPNGVYDWVDFVLNVGKTNTAGHTGGTYGFGKTISYVVSTANAIVIHSRTRYQGRMQTRLMACAVGDEMELNGRLCTGRHWWGRDAAESPEPATGDEATELARAIGMPEFVGDELGTNILILDPDLGGRSPRQALTFIAESVTWHLWPKLVEREGSQPMDIYVSLNGENLEIPDPSKRPPLHGFAQAFRALLDGADSQDAPVGTRHDVIRSQRPKAIIGDLISLPLVQRDRADVDDGHNEEDSDTPPPAAIITGTCHHVALLRTPELVIEYLEGPAPPEGGTEWAGVFRCRDEHDGPFAAAEPPTHDSWIPALLPKSPERTIVNVGLREIRAALDNRWTTRTKKEHTAATSTAVVADELAHLVRTVEGKGAGRETPTRIERTSAGPRAKVEVLSAGPVHHAGGVATLARLRIIPKSGSKGTRLNVATGAALDGAVSDPTLDPQLRLLEARLLGETRELHGTSAVIDIQSPDPTELDLLVGRSSSTTVLFDLEPQAIEGEL